jgi:small subunit ribosomal protein S4
VRVREEKKLLTSLNRQGLVAEGAALDDILNLTVEDVLGRRLQSLVFKKGMAISPLHARQLVVHGHVVIGERSITVPGYLVKKDEEETIKLTGLKAPEAPAREAPAPVQNEKTAEAVAPE